MHTMLHEKTWARQAARYTVFLLPSPTSVLMISGGLKVDF